MKNLFIALGVIFLVIVIVVIGVVGFIAYSGSKLDTSSKAYVDESVPQIVSTWSAKNLLDRASPELLHAASPEQIEGECLRGRALILDMIPITDSLFAVAFEQI